MQGIDLTFGEVSFDGERNTLNVLPQIVLGAVALASIGCVAAYVMRNRLPAAPDASIARRAAASAAAPKAEVASNRFGEMIIEPGWGPKTASPNRDPSSEPGLEALPPTASASISQSEAVPLPSLESVPSAPPAALIQLENVPLPPTRDVARIDDSVPMPPPRPPGFGEPAVKPASPDRFAQPGDTPASAQGDNLNFLQRLLGVGRPSGSTVAPTPRFASACRVFSNCRIASGSRVIWRGWSGVGGSAGTNRRQGAFRLFLFDAEFR